MLADAARIHHEDAVTAGVAGCRPGLETLCGSPAEDVRQVVGQFVAVPYNRATAICPGVELRFTDAGHILGSAIGVADRWPTAAATTA